DTGIEIAFTRVRRSDRPRRLVPRLLIENHLVARLADDHALHDVEQATGRTAERIEPGDLLAGKALTAVDLELADLVLRPLVHTQADECLPVLPIHFHRVLQDLRVDVALRRVQLRNSLREISRIFVVVELALPPPEKAFRLGLDGLDDGFVIDVLVDFDVYA